MSTTTIRLSTPADIIGSVPYLLGFTPTESIVVLALAGNRLVVTCRIDIEDIYKPEAVEPITSAMRNVSATDVVIVGYSVNEELVELATLRAMGVLTDDVVLRDRITVTDDRWYNMYGEDGPVESEEAALAGLEFNALGHGHLSSREDLVKGLQEDPDRSGPVSVAIEAVLTGATPGAGEMLGALRNVLGWGDEPSARDYAIASTLMVTPQYRDVIYCTLAPAVFDNTPTLAMEARWMGMAGEAAGFDPADLTDEARRNLQSALLNWAQVVPDAHECMVGTLTVIGTIFWCFGDGTRAGEVLARALNSGHDPLQATLTIYGAVSQGIKAPR